MMITVRALSALVLAAAVPLTAVGQDPPKPVSFEVASVRANNSADLGARIQEPPGALTTTNTTLRLLIAWAHEITSNQLVSAPDWIRTARFDITARLPPMPANAPQSEGKQRRLALRTLLAERFALVVRRETREVPMFALVLARADGRLGANLKRAAADCAPEAVSARAAAGQAAVSCGTRWSPGRVLFSGGPMSEFTGPLSPFDGRSVIDRTGLTGIWDLEVTFGPDEPVVAPPGQNPPIGEPNAPPLLTAIQDQLGLKLEPTKGLGEVLVVERVERPTEN